MKLLKRLENAWEFWFLFITSIFFFLLRFPSLFEPYWYGDEGIYQVLGMGIRQGKLLYRDIFDNKPPLLYVFYSFFNGDQFLTRLLSLFFGVAAVIAFYYLSKALFKNKKIPLLTTGAFAILFGLPIVEGNIANAENFMLFPIILGGLFLVSQKHFKYKYFLAGLLVGIAFLFKIVAVFDFVAFFLFIIFAKPDLNFNKLRNKGLDAFNFVAGFIIPILLTTVIFISQGAFNDFIKAIFFSNIGYVAYGNKFLIPQGLLILKLVVLSIFIFLVFKKREKLTIPGVFIFLWFAFSLYNAFFSQRPYTHYILVLLPSICLLLGFIFDNSHFRKFSIVIFLVSTVLITQSFWLFTKTKYYYQNFFSFLINPDKVVTYQKFFDGKTPRDYKLAAYIKDHSKKDDTVFIWGNNAQLYKLTNKLPPEKYAVAYHITNYKDGIPLTKKALTKNPPKLIIVMPNVSPYPFTIANYNLKMVIEKVLIYERIF
ncbi:MAG: hypothetical protein A2152_01270 [Candidatus Levybacteria bacterium RBG_16_35_6]|nr:MAG: hypothetical protein A2152_01270 [Candidatus Levybacteria bacterium RBG_16_35_6]